MDKKRRVLGWLSRLMLPGFFLLGMQGRFEAAERHQYESGFVTISRLSQDLCSVLEPKISRTLNPQPMLLDKVAQPYLQPVEYLDGASKVRLVALSVGTVDLLNSFSHARALNSLEPGYFNAYLAQLSTQEEISLPADWQPGTKDKAWGFDTMNLQMSQFNQIAGALLAINMAHHYLGHYQKYAGQLIDAQGHSVPIASVISAADWREAVLKGARNALKCGLGLDGLKSFFEGLEQMPTRPAWALCFLHKEANVPKIKKDLERIEKAFFLSGN